MNKFAVGILLSLCFTFTVIAEPFAVFEGEDGIIEVIGSQVVNYNDKDYVNILLNITNTSQETNVPFAILRYKTFQNGVELVTGSIPSAGFGNPFPDFYSRSRRIGVAIRM